jgi:hypothetical protein
VLQAILLLYKQVINLPTSDTPFSPTLASDDKYNTFFRDCVGALDGTHIEVHVPPCDQPRYRNRKGHLSQNVLAACNFELEFTYILAGWEGSAHDGSVYRNAQYKYGFITPPGKYWLGDAGYPNSDTILAPYRGTRYHLKEQQLASKNQRIPRSYLTCGMLQGGMLLSEFLVLSSANIKFCGLQQSTLLRLKPVLF